MKYIMMFLLLISGSVSAAHLRFFPEWSTNSQGRLIRADDSWAFNLYLSETTALYEHNGERHVMTIDKKTNKIFVFSYINLNGVLDKVICDDSDGTYVEFLYSKEGRLYQGARGYFRAEEDREAF